MTAETQLRDRVLTAGDFAALPEEDGYRLELSRGRLVREPAPGLRHAEVAGRVYRLLWRAGEEEGVGRVLFDAGFILAEDPPTVRVPDVSFVASGRILDVDAGDGFGRGPPDLAVEVVSPSNRVSDMQRKALEYLDAGARLVWVVDPAERTVTVYRSRQDIRILQGSDALGAPDLIPTIRVPVEELFA